MAIKELKERYAELQAERERTWSAELLERNASQRSLLKARFDPANHPAVGDQVPPFTLIDQHGQPITRDALIERGPAVLVFFRFGSCPACNIALPYYNETLWPRLRAAGIPLVAVSAQTPVDTGIIERGRLGFQVASDPEYALGRALGITFFPEDRPAVSPGQDWIGKTLGTDSYEIDQPAVIVIAPDATVRFIDVSPDWLERTGSETILAHLPEAATAVSA